MILIYGEKAYRKKMGFVAEHCPTCASVKPVRIIRLGQTSHIFWLPLGKGRLVGYYGICQECRGEFDIEPTDYAAMSRRHSGDLAELQSTTNPTLDPQNRDAIATQERFRRLRDPLLRVHSSLQQRYAGGTRFDRTTGIAFAATLAIPVVMFTVDLSFLSHAAQQALGQFMILAFVVGLIGSFVLLALEPKRFFRRHLEPQIAKELSEVNPRPDELDSCLARLAKHDYTIRKYVSAPRLMELIQAQQFGLL